MSVNAALLNQVLPGAGKLAWLNSQFLRAEQVKRCRRYYEGDHDAKMTKQMRQALRIKSDNTGAFNDNYMQVVIDTEADRIKLDHMEGDTDAATAWADEVWDTAGLDVVADSVHHSTLEDADSFIMVGWDNEKSELAITHEPAFDGVEGMLAFYNSISKDEIGYAVKIWEEAPSDPNSTLNDIRVNVYYPGRLEKYLSRNMGTLEPYTDSGDPMIINGKANWSIDGKPLGVPVSHFRNRSRRGYGLSEIKNAMPLQDKLNRTLHSMTIAEEFTAFGVYKSKGFDAPTALTPGSIIDMTGGQTLTPDQMAGIDMDKIDGADLSPYINICQWTTGEIGKITQTPAPEFMGGDNASGESLKQREAGLIGKVNRFETGAGQAWERAFKIAHAVQTAFGTQKPPPYKRLNAKWGTAEIRDDTAIVDKVVKVWDKIGDNEALHQLAEVFKWDEEDIQRILADKQQADARRLAQFALNMKNGPPGFANNRFQLPGATPKPPAPGMIATPAMQAAMGSQAVVNGNGEQPA